MSYDFFFHLTKPFLLRMNPEFVHDKGLKLLAFFDSGYSTVNPLISPKTSNPISLNGLDFCNRVGLAAGLDKNGLFVDLLSKFGFASIEVGTITPKPQSGNKKPRLFRLTEQGALINRMGFNNDGADRILKNLRKSQWIKERMGVLGINLGINATTPLQEAYKDYNFGLETFFPIADYFVINISSPNTKNLRALQSVDYFYDLIKKIKENSSSLSKTYKCHRPLFIKLSPDLEPQDIESLAIVIEKLDIEGIIISNTTEKRPYPNKSCFLETGGLSGKPLQEQAEKMLVNFKRRLPSHVTIIGSGGIMTSEDAVARLKAGADLVQFYTGLIYNGPSIVKKTIELTRQETDTKS